MSRISPAHLLILLLAAVAACATPGADGPAATGPAPAGGALRFTAENLYGRIDGGAELFLEFGFRELIVQGYRLGGAELEVETYVMDGPLAALGIYLAKCGREQPVDGVSARSTGNAYQLLALQGDRYLQVNNFGGDAALLPAMASLAEAALAGVPAATEPAIWDLLPAEGQLAGSRRLFRGPFALEPIYTLGEGDVLRLGGEVFGALADYRDGADRRWTRLVVPYPDADAARAAFAHLRANLDPYLEVVRDEPDLLVFRDYSDEHGLVRRDGARLRLSLHLADPPE